LSIADFRVAASDKANWQSEIGNRKSKITIPATRAVVLTSWDRDLSNGATSNGLLTHHYEGRVE
jgi:hypothetical protein